MTVAELLNKKSKWTQLAYARDKNGKEVHSSSPKACCWCILGAISHVSRQSKGEGSIFYAQELARFQEMHGKLVDAIKQNNIALWQDDPNRTFKEVRAAILKAGI